MSYGSPYPVPPPPDPYGAPQKKRSAGVAVLGFLLGLGLCLGTLVALFSAFAVSYGSDGSADGEAAALVFLGLALPVVVPGVLVFFRKTRWFATWMFIAIPIFFIVGPLACTVFFAAGTGI